MPDWQPSIDFSDGSSIDVSIEENIQVFNESYNYIESDENVSISFENLDCFSKVKQIRQKNINNVIICTI